MMLCDNSTRSKVQLEDTTFSTMSQAWLTFISMALAFASYLWYLGFLGSMHLAGFLHSALARVLTSMSYWLATSIVSLVS